MLSKKTIIIIIALMAIAMIGSIALQVNWIRLQISLKDEQFDKSVHVAMARISKRLEIKEDELILKKFKETEKASPLNYNQRNYPAAQLIQESIINSKGEILESGKIFNPLHIPNCKCKDCVYRRHAVFHDNYRSTKLLKPDKIAERISLDDLANIVQQELHSVGITTECTYGIFSNLKKSFVIIKDHFVVDNFGGLSSQPKGKDLLQTSKYKVDLFLRDPVIPGSLMIRFPLRTQVVWSSLWNTLLASIIFTLLILLSFSYTIWAIFKQKKLSEMRTDFINNMTHEFKTPIATISLASDSIMSPMILSSMDKVKKFAGIIKQENQRMNNQVERVLQMALLDKDDFQLNVSDVYMDEVCTQALNNARLRIDKLGGKLTAILNLGNKTIQGDATHLGNIVNNLLDNAIKYSPEKLEITLETRGVDGGVEITIEDKGLGMTPEQQKHVFDKFYRVHTGDVHDVKGFGLGLSYVRKIIDAHQGRIKIKSNLGQGSRFSVFIPFNN